MGEDDIAKILDAMSTRVTKLTQIAAKCEHRGEVPAAEMYSCEAVGIEWSMKVIKKITKYKEK